MNNIILHVRYMTSGISKRISFLSNLNSRLCKIQSEGELLPREDVRVLRLLESSLQLMELKGGECCPGPSNLPRTVRILGETFILLAGHQAQQV